MKLRGTSSIGQSPRLITGLVSVRTRGARFGVLLIAFVTMAVYWQVQVASIYVGEKGFLPPWLAVEIPNILVALCGIYSFRKASW